MVAGSTPKVSAVVMVSRLSAAVSALSTIPLAILAGSRSKEDFKLSTKLTIVW